LLKLKGRRGITQHGFKTLNLSKTPSNAGETAEQQYLGGVFGKQYEEIVQAAGAARRQLSSLDAFEAGGEGFETGPLANVRLAVGKIANLLNIDIAGMSIDDISGAEAKQAVSRKLAKSMRVPGEGVMSDADLAMLIQQVVSLENTPDGNKKIAAVMRRVAERQFLREKMANDWMKGEGKESMRGFSAIWQDYIGSNSLFPNGYGATPPAAAANPPPPGFVPVVRR
jgi:hypothetical protein